MRAENEGHEMAGEAEGGEQEEPVSPLGSSSSDTLKCDDQLNLEYNQRQLRDSNTFNSFKRIKDDLVDPDSSLKPERESHGIKESLGIF